MSNISNQISNGSDNGLIRKFSWGIIYMLLVIAVLSVIASSIVFVDESESVIIERLGHISAVYDRPADRGLHFKLPWPIGTARRFDRRVQLFDPPGREIFTRDKKNITIDTYICWKIAEVDETASNSLLERPVVRFFRSLGNVDVAQARLDSRVRSILSTEIGLVELSSLLQVEDSELGPDGATDGLLQMISLNVSQQVSKRANEEGSIRDRLGIEIVDVRIKRINFPLGNQQAVFARMKSERRKIADSYRSAGMAENTVIKSQADRQYNELIAKADADAERIRGEAEAESLTILNKAHAQDPEFYKFIRTLDTYRKIMNDRTTLVLSASSNLLKLLTEGVPDEIPETKTPNKSPSTPATTEGNQNSTDADATKTSEISKPDSQTGLSRKDSAEDIPVKTTKEETAVKKEVAP